MRIPSGSMSSSVPAAPPATMSGSKIPFFFLAINVPPFPAYLCSPCCPMTRVRTGENLDF